MAHKALVLDDSNNDALRLLSFLDLKRPDPAVADARRAVAINPNYAGGYEALSVALNISFRNEEAIRAAQKAMRLDPANRDFYGYLLGNAYDQMGR
jgi:adenylate cyclase